MIYMIGYFIIQEGFNGSGSIQTILQNESVHHLDASVSPSDASIRVIQFNTLESTILSGVSFFTGATGTLFIYWVQLRWKLRTKASSACWCPGQNQLNVFHSLYCCGEV